MFCKDQIKQSNDQELKVLLLLLSTCIIIHNTNSEHTRLIEELVFENHAACYLAKLKCLLRHKLLKLQLFVFNAVANLISFSSSLGFQQYF